MLSRIIDLIEEDELAPSRKIKYQLSAKGHELAQVLLGLAATHEHVEASVYINRAFRDYHQHH
jgi:2-oxoisovalerate dehydrogenase E1 component